MIKKEKKVVVKTTQEPDDHYYKLEESVAKLTGVTHVVTDTEGKQINVVYNFTLVDKFVYSVMHHRYLSFKAFNDKAKQYNKKPDGRFYFDNQVELAQRLNVDRKTINKSIDKLVTVGIVEKFFQRARNASGMSVKSLSYKVNNIFDTKNLRCFFDVSAEGSDTIERTFICRGEQALQQPQKPATIQQSEEPPLAISVPHWLEEDDDPNYPF